MTKRLSLYNAAGEQADYERRCLETLETAIERTPVYQSWKSYDPGPGQNVDERYHSLPVLTKDDIRAHFPYGLVPNGLDLDAALARGEISFVRTSGTADEALENLWNQQWWNASESASWKLNSVAMKVATGAHREAILASALSVGPRSEKEPFDRENRTLGRFLFLNEYATPGEWPKDHERRILSELAEYRPEIFEANPSLIARLARFALKTGASVYQPPLITLTYEFPSALQMRAIRRVFQSPVVSSYGSTEAGYVFMECEHGRLHQNAEFCRVDLAPLNNGLETGIGRLFVTTFRNPWFPLVRFDIGDIGRIAPDPCPCGRTSGMTLSAVEGRLKSLCIADNGRPVTHREVDNALAAVDGLEQYRLVQEELKRVSLAVVSENSHGKRVAQDAKDMLHGIFGHGMTIRTSVVSTLLPEKSGKFLLASRGFPLAPFIGIPKTKDFHG